MLLTLLTIFGSALVGCGKKTDDGGDPNDD
jgi:hypothetical protein